MQIQMTASLKASQVNGANFGARLSEEMIANLSTSLGTAAGQADRLYLRERQVASASNDDIDLAGVLLDAFGTTLTIAELVALFIINAPRTGNPNTTNLTIGGGTNPVTTFLGGTTPTIGPIRPGGFVFIGCTDAAGMGLITASTADILRIANSSGAQATYQIGILGRSVA